MPGKDDAVRTRRAIGAMILILVSLCAGATAAAGQTYPIDPPEVEGDNTTPDDRSPDPDRSEERRPAVQGSSQAGSGALPFTGAELLLVALIGIAIIAVGTTLVLWRRRQAV